MGEEKNSQKRESGEDAKDDSEYNIKFILLLIIVLIFLIIVFLIFVKLKIYFNHNKLEENQNSQLEMCIEMQTLNQSCISIVKNSNMSACTLIKDKEQDKCFYSFALIEQNRDLCTSIKDSNIKSQCLLVPDSRNRL